MRILAFLLFPLLLMGQYVPTIPTNAGGAPTLVLHQADGTEDNKNTLFGTSPWTLHMFHQGSTNTGTLAGNCLGVAISYVDTLTFSTPTDDKSDTYTLVTTAHDVTNGQKLSIWITSAATGAKHIQATFTGTATVVGIMPWTFEWTGTRGCTVDTSGISTGTGSNISLTTTATDMIWEVAVVDDILRPATGNITPGAGFSLLSATRIFGEISQWIPSTTSGSKTCQFSGFGTHGFVGVCIAVKVAAGGTAPTGMHLAHIEGIFEGNTATADQFPTQGNLQVGMWAAGQVTLTTSSSDTNSNTWNVPASGHVCQTPGCASVIYAQNAVSSTNEVFTPVYSGTNTGGACFLMMYDFVGANVSPFDNAHNTTGVQSTSGTLTADTYTPTTTSTEFVLNITTFFAHTATGVNTTGAVFSWSWGTWLDDNGNGGVTNDSQLQEDDGRAALVTTSTSAVTFIYPNTTSGANGIGNWESVSAGFHQ